MSALDHLLDAQALNDTEARRLFNPSEEPDSLLEYIESLPMPAHTRRVLRGCASSIVQLNDRERECERAATADLAHVRDTLGVKGAARMLRPVLGCGDYVREVTTVRDLLAEPRCGVRVLTARSMRSELGKAKTARLNELVALLLLEAGS
jgi:hypothetical protein